MRRGEIWLINLDPVVGSEISKTRPAVILNTDLMGNLPLKIVVPITGWRSSFASAPWHVKLEPDNSSGLKKISSADTYQVRSVSDQRLVKKLGQLTPELIEQIESGLLICLGIG